MGDRSSVQHAVYFKLFSEKVFVFKEKQIQVLFKVCKL
jgi:hypothetical protein